MKIAQQIYGLLVIVHSYEHQCDAWTMFHLINVCVRIAHACAKAIMLYIYFYVTVIMPKTTLSELLRTA